MLKIYKLTFFFVISFLFFIQTSYQYEYDVNHNDNKLYLYIKKNIDQSEINFSKNLPFQSLLEGILQGIYPYELFIKHEDDLSTYTVIKSTSSYTYILGKPTINQLDDITKKLTNYKDVIIICDESLHKHFIQNEFRIQPRIELEYPLDYKKYKENIPSGFKIEELNIRLLEQSPWYGFLCSLLGGPKKFLETIFAFALVDKNGISIAQAYGTMIGNNSCEIGVVTHPDYRGKGYIIYPAIKVIEKCLNLNLKPIWSCNTENIASLKTALKLGFIIKRHYAFLKKIKS